MRKIILTIAVSAFILGIYSCGTNRIPKQEYPVAQKEDVSDYYFGTKVADPYRWLENDTTKAVADWVAAENKVAESYLGKISFRNNLRKRLTELVDYEKIGIPFKKHGKYYFYKNNGLQNQSVLYCKDSLNGEASVLLDPNKLSDDGTVALSSISFSKNGKYMAYTISRNGSDWREIYVMDLATKKLIADHIKWAKFTNAEWCGNGFYYSAYDAPTQGKEFSNVNENHKIYYHKIGEEQSNDQLVYQDKKYPKRFYSASVSEDENMLFITESGAGLGNRLFVKNLKKKNSNFIEMASNFEYQYSPGQVVGNTIYIFTNFNASKYKIMKADISSPKIENWKEVLPESENAISGLAFIGGKMIVNYMKDASEHAYVYDMDGKMEHEVVLPALGSVSFSGDFEDPETFYLFTSFTFPSTIYKYDLSKNISEKYLSPKVDFNPEEFETKQVFYPSKDGTKIPMFLVYKKGIKLDGNNPVYLYGYGGFNVSLNPRFSVTRIPFLENGGIYAQANLRGGGEYGEEWHIAGTKMKKQNVFDDFISAAEYLITEKYTNPKKIAISGASNGGLLIGACVNQRPDLFAVALPAVGVMDMLRYHKFTIGWNWASDYGTCEDGKEMFEYLHTYSPLHNIKNDGTKYPAILITTADHDDRVVPAHSFKYAAMLQASNTGDAPKLILIETKAGHGSGKPISKVIDEQTDCYAFVMYNLEMKPKFK